MHLRRKLRNLSSYYKHNGLTETIGAINSRVAGWFVRRKKAFDENSYPSQVSLEIMDVCNLKCRHCYLHVRSDSPKGLMDYEYFEKIIQRISPLIKRARSFDCSTVEALLHNRFFDMFDRVVSINQDIKMHINTNGMLLDEDRIDKLLRRNITSYNISLDGCRRETVESFKEGVDFDRVVGNARNLIKKGGHVGTIFVAHKNNINELIDYVDFCKKIGVESIQVIGLISYCEEMVDACLYSETGIKEINELFRKAKRRSLDIGIQLSHKSTKLHPEGCISPDQIYIDMEGNVAACVVLSRKNPLLLLDKKGTTNQVIWGNVFEEDPYKIWTSKESVEFRRLLHKNKLPHECALCPVGHGVIC